ncbi:ribosome hibernation-promoting factor, HPF/YfiA family [Patiriisocius hiemis]|uniref:Ribosome-associated translation inhibitor RaiA n=1 Tax=Patiriisocius hiemis TaxID=3075604 RepID=A0ABU2YAF0_9FLAO|nr:ribosome-associated translation inhibitor RaiA [Constantimarinum sp. W242]MDT0554831.1 ribosome-associated translation inhibitor RaiA [Constantimarinum sp. W242]
MNINFEYKDVTASKRLEELVTEKLNKLENKYDFMVGADVYFKKENTSSPDSGMHCDIRINIPKSTLYASTSKGSFEAAIAQTTSELRSQLEKKKGKMQTH